MSDFRVTKILLDPFVAISEDDENDVLFGWMDEADDFPENFYEDEEETEYFYSEKNLTFSTFLCYNISESEKGGRK